MHKHLNFFSRILVLFCVLATLLSVTPFAHAQVNTGNNPGNPNAPGYYPSPTPAPAVEPVTSTVGGGRGTVVEEPGARAIAAQNVSGETAAITTPVDESDSKIYNTAVWLGGFIASLGGGLFDGAIENVVLKMGCWFTNDTLATGSGDSNRCGAVGGGGAVGGVVNELWSVVRDLFNILFIFALVWIGLRMILFAEDSGTQRTLGMLIAAALLINFSLYFTKVIVDVSNYTAVAIHSVAVGGLQGQFGFEVGEISPGSTGHTAVVANYTPESASLASAYMQALKISSWFSGAPITSTSEILVYSIILLLFSIILGFTLAFGALMLITRFIALVILMIFSPAMFLGWILPGFQKHASMWWSKFIGYAFFAPAYIFMLYLGLYTLIQLSNSMGSRTYAQALSGSWSTGMFTIFLFYALGIGFLIAATKVGQQMSVAGSSVAMSTTQGALRRMRNGALAGPRALGRGAKWGASYGASSAVGSASSWAGKKMDAASAESDTERSRWARGRRALVAKGETAKFGGSSSYKERTDGDKAEKKRHTAVRSTRQTQLDMASTDAATRETAFQNATSEQVVQIAKTAEGRKVLMQNAHLLSSGKLDAITKSEDVGETETKEIQKAYAKGTADHVIGTTASPGKGIGKASNAELNAIGYDKLFEEENVINLTPEKIDKLDLIDTHKDSLKAERSRILVDIVRNDNSRGSTSLTSLSNMSSAKIADLPDGAFFATTPAEAANVQKFIRGISFDALTEVSRKKDNPVKQQMRSILNSMADPKAADGSYEKELHEWLSTDRVGRKFGIR